MAIEAAQSVQNAYQIRTRLRRGLLSTVRRVAQSSGIDPPALPGVYRPHKNLDAQSREIVELCNEIHAGVSRLCQPSEALDTRWAEGWDETLESVERLRALIQTD